MVGHLSEGALRTMRAVEVRFVGLTLGEHVFSPPFRHEEQAARKAWLYLVRSGPVRLRVRPDDPREFLLREGDLAGLEGGWHEWISQDGAEYGTAPTELLYSSVDIKSAILRQLADGVIIIRRQDTPYAGTIRQCLELMETDAAESPGDDGVRRRLAEVCMLQMVRFARARVIRPDMLPAETGFDPHILNALAAFFAAPNAAWTVSKLANEAGLSRAVFFERFQSVFARSPMKMIGRVRLQMASEMLQASSCSLEEVAQAVGYGSAPAFVRAFRREFGMTPGEHRQLGRLR